MQTYDFLMLGVLAATTMFGFWKGMAWQIASLASLVLSYFAALRFSAQLAPMFGDHAPWNRFVAMLAIYIVTSFVIWTSFRLVSGAIDKVKLEAFDRQIGALFGFAKGVLLCIAITFFAVTLMPPAQGEAIVDSQSGRYIVALLDKAHSVFPPEVHDVIDPYLNKIEQRLRQGGQPHGQDLQNLWPSQAQGPAATGGGQTFGQPTWPSATELQQDLQNLQKLWPQQSPQAPSTTPSSIGTLPSSTSPYAVPR